MAMAADGVTTPEAPRLVVNADDFGLSPGVNQGIVAGHKLGIVSSTTVMANLPDAAQALRLARTETPNLGIGLHLNLTAGRPLSSPAAVPSLVREDGRFHSAAGQVMRLLAGRVRMEDIRREVHAQISWCLAHDLKPDHIDGHHHIHVYPLVADVVLDACSLHGVAGLRAPRDGAREGGLAMYASTRLVSHYGKRLGSLAIRNHLCSPRHFHGVSVMGTDLTEDYVVALLHDLTPGSHELLCHPGYEDDAARALTSYVSGREHELTVLTSERVARALRDSGVQLVTYGRLTPLG